MHIIWDWNGTLLDDVALAVAVNNRIRGRYGYPPVSLVTHRDHFTFPVRHFYRLMGVPDEMFLQLAVQYNNLYEQEALACPLHADALATVRALHQMGHTQGILSAAPEGYLRRHLSVYEELTEYMAQVFGTSSLQEEGKLHLGQPYLAEGGRDPRDVMLIGDTCHDAEVARSMGIRCALVSAGHQAPHVLEKAGVPVYPTLTAWLQAEGDSLITPNEQ